MGFTFSKIGKNILTQSFSLSFFTIFLSITTSHRLQPHLTQIMRAIQNRRKKTVVATEVTTTAIDCISNSTIRSVG
jgi:hypothetical protein